MKKIIIGSIILAGLTSCGGYTEEQGNAATDFCECMEKDEFGEFDINFYECEVKINSEYGSEISGDEGYTEALEEKCPDIASEFTDS